MIRMSMAFLAVCVSLSSTSFAEPAHEMDRASVGEIRDTLRDISQSLASDLNENCKYRLLPPSHAMLDKMIRVPNFSDGYTLELCKTLKQARRDVLDSFGYLGRVDNIRATSSNVFQRYNALQGNNYLLSIVSQKLCSQDSETDGWVFASESELLSMAPNNRAAEFYGSIAAELTGICEEADGISADLEVKIAEISATEEFQVSKAEFDELVRKSRDTRGAF